MIVDQTACNLERTEADHRWTQNKISHALLCFETRGSQASASKIDAKFWTFCLPLREMIGTLKITDMLPPLEMRVFTGAWGQNRSPFFKFSL